MTGIDEMSSTKKMTPMLASWLAIIKAQIEFIRGEHSTGETLKNIVTNIERNIEESLDFGLVWSQLVLHFFKLYNLLYTCCISVVLLLLFD